MYSSGNFNFWVLATAPELYEVSCGTPGVDSDGNCIVVIPWKCCLSLVEDASRSMLSFPMMVNSFNFNEFAIKTLSRSYFSRSYDN